MSKHINKKNKNIILADTISLLPNQIDILNRILQGTNMQVTSIKEYIEDQEDEENIHSETSKKEECEGDLLLLNRKRQKRIKSFGIRQKTKNDQMRNNEMSKLEGNIELLLLKECRILKEKMKAYKNKSIENIDILNYICRDQLSKINKAHPIENSAYDERIEIANTYRYLVFNYRDDFPQVIESLNDFLVKCNAKYDKENDILNFRGLYTNKLKSIKIKLKKVKSFCQSNPGKKSIDAKETLRTDYTNNLITSNLMSIESFEDD